MTHFTALGVLVFHLSNARTTLNMKNKQKKTTTQQPLSQP